MRRVRAAVAGIAVAAMTLGIAAPAGAQEEPEALGFAVDKTEAQPGALVLGKADADDVAEHCTTDLEEFQARFEELQDLLIDLDSEPFLTFFPEGEVYENYGQTAYALTFFAVVGLANNAAVAEGALPQTFVMTFADIATQEPVGERSNFDPDTGEGSVVVPDVEPGLWAVAAACVGPSLDVDTLVAGIEESGAFVEELGAPVDFNSEEFTEFIEDFTGETGFSAFVAFLEEIGPTLVENIVTPDAFGAVLFCVLDAEGNCPADEPPAPPPGEPAPPPSEEPAAAQPIVAAPTFTG